MTLKEFVRMLWAGKWLLLASIAVSLVAGAAFLATREVPFHSLATVQLRIDAPTAATVAPPVVTIDPVDVTSVGVAARATEILGDGSLPAEIVGAVDASHDPVTARVTIGAEALSEERAVAVANAFAQAYVEHIDARWADAVAAIDKNMAAARTKATDLQAATAATPPSPGAPAVVDPIAAADLEAVLASYGTLAAQQNIAAALGSPASLALAASGGTPIGMGTAPVLALAVLAGLLLGLGLALLRRALDSTVSTAKLARTLAGAPVLAELADVRRSAQAAAVAGLLPVDGKSATPFTESIRELRTAVQATEEGSTLTIVVSATEPDAPRSFIVANLAASWALSGRDTIVMSGDLRRSDLESLLPAPDGWADPWSEAGAHDARQAEARLRGLHGDDQRPDERQVLAHLRPTAVKGLRYLPAPVTGLDPADYLASASARRLIDEVRAAAEVVIIDAPPVLAAADAIILGSYADGVVLVATVGHTDRGVLEDAASRLAGANVTLIGVALHGRTADKRMTYASTYAPEPSDAPHARPAPRVPVPTGEHALPDERAREEEPARRSGPHTAA